MADKHLNQLKRLLQDSKQYKSATCIIGRIYYLDGNYYKMHDVSCNSRFLGFLPVQCPNPADRADARLAQLVDIYGADQVAKHAEQSIARFLQHGCRQQFSGRPKMSQADFCRIYDSLDTDTLHRLKTMECIHAHCEQVWAVEQAANKDTVKIFPVYRL